MNTGVFVEKVQLWGRNSRHTTAAGTGKVLFERKCWGAWPEVWCSELTWSGSHANLLQEHMWHKQRKSVYAPENSINGFCSFAWGVLLPHRSNPLAWLSSRSARVLHRRTTSNNWNWLDFTALIFVASSFYVESYPQSNSSLCYYFIYLCIYIWIHASSLEPTQPLVQWVPGLSRW